MLSVIFKFFILLIVLRVGWGIVRGFRLLSRAGRASAPDEPNRFEGSEIEDADWEEIGEDDRNTP